MKWALDHLRKSDARLSTVIDQVGPYSIEYRAPDFDTLVRSITYQQISGRAAETIYGRFAKACGPCGVTPDRVLRMRRTTLRAAGFSQTKVAYIRDLAQQVRDGRVDLAAMPELDDRGVIDALTGVKGIGVWTAQMFLIFALKRPDVLPHADLGVRAAMRNIYGLEDLPKPAEMDRIAAPWRPFASVASWYLWRSLDGPAAL